MKSSQSGAQFDCQAFTKSVLLPDLALPGCPLLTGRGLWLASKMAPLLNPETLTPYVWACVPSAVVLAVVPAIQLAGDGC